MFKRLLLLPLVFCFCSLCYGQANDITISVGGMSGPDASPPGGVTCVFNDPLQRCNAAVATTARIAYEGTFGHRVVNLHLVSFHLDVPVLGTPTRTLKQGLFRQDFSSVFVTPGLRVKFSLPIVSPFAVIGGGLAHFSGSAAPQTPATSNTTGALEFGGGVDIKTPIPFLSLRGEFRQFHTGNPGFATTETSRTNRFAGAGIVLRF